MEDATRSTVCLRKALQLGAVSARLHSTLLYATLRAPTFALSKLVGSAQLQYVKTEVKLIQLRHGTA